MQNALVAQLVSIMHGENHRDLPLG